MFSFHIDMKGTQQAKKQLRRLANKQLTSVLRKALRNGAKLVQKVKKLPPDARTIEARENGTERIAKHLLAEPT